MKQMRIVGALSLSLALAAVLAFAQPQAKSDNHLPATRAHAAMPVLQWSGYDSKIADRRYLLVTTPDQWKALWIEHTGITPTFAPPERHTIPIIDFTRFCVVAAFDGSGINTDGLVADSIVTSDRDVRLRFTTSSFQTMGRASDDGGAITSKSFGIWIIERTTKPIVLERDATRVKDDPASWTQVATLTAK